MGGRRCGAMLYFVVSSDCVCTETSRECVVLRRLRVAVGGFLSTALVGHAPSKSSGLSPYEQASAGTQTGCMHGVPESAHGAGSFAFMVSPSRAPAGIAKSGQSSW